MQKQIFRKYDIRGVVGTSFLISEVYKLSQAIVSYFLDTNQEAKRVVVAMDGRTHSQEIYEHVAKAVTDSGLDIYFLGVCPTPVLLHALHNLPVDAGIMITASHNTKEYNGFKLYNNKKSLFGDDISTIWGMYQQGVAVKSEYVGKVVPCPIIDQYVDVLYQRFPYLSQYDFKMIIDCGNGTVGPVLQKLIKKMDWKDVRLLNVEVDGTFPNHEADPTIKENMTQLIMELKNNPEYFGVGFDGDGDRMIGLTNQGEIVLGDVMLSLFAQDMLKEDHSEKVSVVYDVKSTSVVPEVVVAGNGEAIISQTGCSFIQRKMDEVGALLGGELSGHYFFRDRHEGYDDALYAMLRLFDVVIKQQSSIYDLLAQLPQKHASCEIRIPCDDLKKEFVVEKIGDHLHSAGWRISKVDGVRAEHDKGWGLLRISNTQPVVSFRCEADTKQDVQMIKAEFSKALQGHISSDLIEKHLS